MNWPHNITGDIPAPRDDEPENLRQNINDELADHLQCALNREQLLTSDENQAKENVLTRFGNVNRIARKLWFDWMKEKIMSQRIMLAASIVMTLTCIAVGGIAWMAIQRNQSVNAALLEKIHQMAARPQESQQNSLEWNEVKVTLVKGKTGGPSAKGWSVHLARYMTDNSKGDRFFLDGVTNSEGIVDFGMVPFGYFQLEIRAPWKEETILELMVRPGEPQVLEVVCPEAAPETANVTITIDWPEDLKQKALWAVCGFERHARHSAKERWYFDTSLYDEDHAVIVTGSQKLIDVADADKIYWRSAKQPSDEYGTIGFIEEEYNRIQLDKLQMSPQKKTVRRFNTTHRLEGIEILLPPFDERILASVPMKTLGRFPYQPQETSPMFSVDPEKKNHWKITLPEKLLEEVREKLKEQKNTPRSQAPRPLR